MALKQQIHISRVGVKLKHLSRGAPKGKVCVGHLSSLAYTALREIYIIISSSDSHRHCLYSASPSPKSKHMLCEKRCRLRLFIYLFIILQHYDFSWKQGTKTAEWLRRTPMGGVEGPSLIFKYPLTLKPHSIALISFVAAKARLQHSDVP